MGALCLQKVTHLCITMSGSRKMIYHFRPLTCLRHRVLSCIIETPRDTTNTVACAGNDDFDLIRVLDYQYNAQDIF